MAKKNKVPRKIAGVKLPKPLRRGLRDLAASQNGRAALTEALDAAGAALAASQAKPAAKTAKAAAAQAPTTAGANAKAEARAATVAALEDAARSFTDALKRRGPPETATPPTASTH